jgi:hypothetical protein
MDRQLFSKEYKDKGDFRNILIAICVLIVMLIFVYAYATILHTGTGK